MGIVNFVLREAAKSRIKELERYSENPSGMQRIQLKHLLQKGAYTEYGKFYGFGRIKSCNDFREAVPVRNYESFRPYIERGLKGEDNVLWPEPVRWYAKSSGTTGSRSKYLPVSPSSLRMSHLRGGRDSIYMALHCYPESRAFDGKTLALGGSHTIGDEGFGIRTGDLSAIMIANAPKWTNRVKVPSPEVMLIPDWDRKTDMICDITRNMDVRCLAGVPSWFLTLIQKLLDKTGASSASEIWPNLQLFIHGGIGFDSYRSVYRQLIPDERMRYLETYNASEGFFGIQSSPDDSSLMLMLDYGTYYEFIPSGEWESENPHTLTLEEVKTGENYALVITTCSGLWRYKIGDTVMFTSLNPYKFRITGRTQLYINAFGEELMIDNANSAIAFACGECGCEAFDYSVAPIFMERESRGAHEWIVEFVTPPADIDVFTAILDKKLREVNSDYDAKRNSSLDMPVVHAAPHGFFNGWLKDEGKLGGQNKIPRLKNDRSLMDVFLKRLQS